MSSYYRQQLEDWLKTIDINTNIVCDIGGAANPVNKRLKSFKANEYLIFDNGAEEKYHNEFPNYMPFDINKEYKLEFENKADVIFCLEVFEYVYNPIAALENLYNLGKKDSIYYLSLPSIYPYHNPKEIDYLRYTKSFIENILNRYFFIIEMKSRKATVGKYLLADFYSSERMHPVKNDAAIYDLGYLLKVKKI